MPFPRFVADRAVQFSDRDVTFFADGEVHATLKNLDPVIARTAARLWLAFNPAQHLRSVVQ